MKMDFSVGIGRHLRMDQVAEHTRVAEESGFKQITFIDSQNLSRDVYAQMTIAALNTSHIQIGQGVTNPFTRHPSVTANATATIDELSGGRVFLGIGAGYSSVFTMEMKARPLRELREMVDFIRPYMSGKEAEYKGAKMHSEWVRRPVPIYFGSGGPKSLLLSGELADGVICTCVHPEVVKWRVEQVKKGAMEAGRDPSKIDIWARTIVYVSKTKEYARPEVSAYATQGGHKLLQQSEFADLRERLESKEPGILAEFKAVRDAYLPYNHERPDAPHGKAATQRVIDFFHLTGEPEEIVDRIHQLAEAGVTNISCVFFTISDKIAVMRKISDKIMPHFRN